MSSLNKEKFATGRPSCICLTSGFLPTFPKRDVAVFFVAENERVAKITLLHDRDLKEWSSYVTSRERAMIREMRGK
jgi:hypothetical protein